MIAANPDDGARQEASMSKQASGTFAVTITAQAPEAGVGDPAIGRMALFKQFSGDLEGSAHGQMLATHGQVAGSAAYVALDRVNGRLHGREGAFSLQHCGVMDRGTPQLSLTVVPDSGTGELTGLSGSMAIRIVEGQHFYDIHYSLPDAD
jgi:hypothetical protein